MSSPRQLTNDAEEKSSSASIINLSLFRPAAPAKKREGTLTLGSASLTKPLTKLKTASGYYLYFKLNDHTQLINEGARLIAEKVRELNIENPYFVTPEASTFAMAYALRDKYGIDGLNIYKTKQDDDTDPVSVTYYAITDPAPKTLFLCKNKIAAATANKNIIIIDSVCTTGGTLIALYDLLVKAGVNPKSIHGAVSLFDEGEARESLPLNNQGQLKLYTFGHLHLYDENGNIKTHEAPRLS